MFDRYVMKVFQYANIRPGTHTAGILYQIVETMPFTADGPPEKMEKLDLDITLERHAKRCFFDMLSSDKPFSAIQWPVLVSKQNLQHLEGWADWKTLAEYLLANKLRPALFFRNTSHRFGEDWWYPAEFRVFAAMEGHERVEYPG